MADSKQSSEIDLQQIGFDPADAKTALAQLPTSPAVFALYGADAHAEPYIGRTPNLRARLARLLQPSDKHPRRLQLAGRVRQIRWRLIGSEFEALLGQFTLLEQIYGAKALERMHLGAPSFIRYLGSNPYPRITVTNHPSQREAGWAYGPFQSRATAERFAEEALKLFLLRRCTEELEPSPSHPGCVYSEMKMCLAPCYKGCTDERYAEEAAAVEQFLATRGESRLITLRAQREEASAKLDFENAAALHAQVQRVESVKALASELVRPLLQLRAVVLQASANPGEVAVFLYENGRFSGPAGFSTLGMRIQNEQSGSTSLFAHPMAIEAIPEAPGPKAEPEVQVSSEAEAPIDSAELMRGLKFHPSEQKSLSEDPGKPPPPSDSSSSADCNSATSEVRATDADTPMKLARGVLEARMEAALAELSAPSGPISATIRQGHLALLKRWYYRAEIRRSGEIFFPNAEGRWPVKALLRGVGRVAGKMVAAGNHTG